MFFSGKKFEVIDFTVFFLFTGSLLDNDIDNLLKKLKINVVSGSYPHKSATFSDKISLKYSFFSSNNLSQASGIEFSISLSTEV